MAEAEAGLHGNATIWAEPVCVSRRLAASYLQDLGYVWASRDVQMLHLLGDGVIHEALAVVLPPLPSAAVHGSAASFAQGAGGFAQEEGPRGRVAATASRCGVVRIVCLKTLQRSRAHRHILVGVEAHHLLAFVGDLEIPRGKVVNEADEGIALVSIGLRINGQVQKVEAPCVANAVDLIHKHLLRIPVRQIPHHDRDRLAPLGGDLALAPTGCKLHMAHGTGPLRAVGSGARHQEVHALTKVCRVLRRRPHAFRQRPRRGVRVEIGLHARRQLRGLLRLDLGLRLVPRVIAVVDQGAVAGVPEGAAELGILLHEVQGCELFGDLAAEDEGWLRDLAHRHRDGFEEVVLHKVINLDEGVLDCKALRAAGSIHCSSPHHHARTLGNCK
mmetsp:Transcript_97108/g.246927  ORF Transcript_97108/g.246927 Transcript_97108/m.246927 type:complete len:387 (-) Transcript_97108:20-1180(-)